MRVPALSEAERARISEAIRAAEAKTAGEIYVVIAKAAGEFRFVPILWAAIFALLLPWPLHLLTLWSTSTILLFQALAFVLSATALSQPFIRHRIVPAHVTADAARKAAELQFLAHGVHLTQARTGVLIYVALAHRRVEIVADDVIDKEVDQSEWDELAETIAAAARAGRLADGLVTAVGRAGALLAQHFPARPEDRNELPDRVVEIA
jgi:putative membrane protein